MCDYSLEMVRSRDARKGEQLILHRFGTGTQGFVGQAISGTSAAGTKSAIADPVIDKDCAVCVKEGTRLRLQGISPDMQRAFGIGQSEIATMIRMNDASPHVHHDGLRFDNGKELLLQALNTGIAAVISPPMDLEKTFKLDKPLDTSLDDNGGESLAGRAAIQSRQADLVDGDD